MGRVGGNRITLNETQRLEGVLAAKTTDEVKTRYDDWASSYETDMARAGYRTPTVACGLFGRHVPVTEDPILDAGAGTGLCGELLHFLGYKNVVGVDASEGMLEIARRKNVYQALHKAVLGEPLDFPDDTFAGVISLGVLIPGHAPPESLDELVRVTKPGGVLVFNVGAKEYETSGFKAKHEALEREGKWERLEHAVPFPSLPWAVDSFVSQVCAYRVK